MTLSLRQRILWWGVASTLVILLVVFVVVDRSLRSTIRTGLEESVVSAARFAAELQRSEVEDGLQRTSAMAGGPTLRAAVETGDAATISENLDVLLAGSDVEWLAVASPDGEVVATAGQTPVARIEAARSLLQEARFYDTADLWVVDGALVEVHAGGIFVGASMAGVLLSGERVGGDRIQRLELATQQEIAIASDEEVLAGGEDLSSAARAALVGGWPGAPVGGPETRGVEDASAREIPGDDGAVVASSVPLPGLEAAVAGRVVAYRSLEEAMAPARRLRLILLAVAAGGVLLAFAFSFVLARGVTRPVQRLLRETVRLGSGDLAHPVEPERDDEIGRLAEGFDEMRRSLLSARSELVRAERLSAVGRAASAIVHDFSQPVNVIQGNVELLEYDWDDPEAREEDVRVIRREVQRLTSMMQEILDYARGEDRIRRTTGSVPELLDDLRRRFRPQLEPRGIELVVNHGYDGRWSLDFPRTTRVLENLIRNAASAIRSDGTIEVTSARRDDVLRLTVADDGPGLPEELTSSLFEPFVTRGKEKGTGLGLAIAQSFTERQGGTIRYETSEEGTIFILEFPANGNGAGSPTDSSSVEGATDPDGRGGPTSRDLTTEEAPS